MLLPEISIKVDIDIDSDPEDAKVLLSLFTNILFSEVSGVIKTKRYGIVKRSTYRKGTVICTEFMGREIKHYKIRVFDKVVDISSNGTIKVGIIPDESTKSGDNVVPLVEYVADSALAVSVERGGRTDGKRFNYVPEHMWVE